MKSSILVVALVLLAAATSPCAHAAGDDADKKAVLVTGATSGIGLQIAKTFAASGFHVYAGARKDEDMQRLDAMDNITAVRLDVTKQDQVDAAAELVRGAGRGLWGVVNNAGVVANSPLSTGSEADMEFTFAVNVYGPYRVNKAFLPLLMESGGRTTTIGSISGFLAGPGGSYSMSKAAAELYTDSLAEELEESGVHVSIVEPGGYQSRIRDKMAERLLAEAEASEAGITDEVRARAARLRASNASLKEPDEVAAAVLELMTATNPRRRYMVTPNEEQADSTIRAALQRALELNEGHRYSMSRDELVALLEELLAAGD